MSAKIVALIADLDGYDFVHRDDVAGESSLSGNVALPIEDFSRTFEIAFRYFEFPSFVNYELHIV